jgi:hypothetical protein
LYFKASRAFVGVNFQSSVKPKLANAPTDIHIVSDPATITA